MGDIAASNTISPGEGQSLPPPDAPSAWTRARRLMGMARDFGNRPAWRASMVNLGFYGTSQMLRFAGNLVLARLLFPSEFGLMALANTLRQGIEMLSDIGIGPSIVQSPRGDDRTFINTAWTLQVLRGVVMWLVALAMTYPVHVFYGKDPMLLYVFPIVALQGAIGGFNSASLYTLQRHLRLGRIAALNLTAQICGLVTMVVAAWYVRQHPNLAPYAVWSLVAGGLVQQVVQTLGSHALNREARPRFQWDPTAVRSIFHFAKWIFVSTLLTYFGMQLDALMLGRFLSQSDLGLFSTAKQFATVVPTAVATLGGAVMFPVLSRTVREEPHRIRDKVEWVRFLVLVPSALAVSLLVIFGNDLIHLLYRPEFHGAGWMLRVLAVGGLGVMIAPSYGAAMMALGRSDQVVYLLLSLLFFMVTGSLVGYYFFGGLQGFLVGLALTEWLNYPFVARRARRHGVWTPRVDLAVLLITLGAIGLAFLRG